MGRQVEQTEREREFWAQGAYQPVITRMPLTDLDAALRRGSRLWQITVFVVSERPGEFITHELTITSTCTVRGLLNTVLRFHRIDAVLERDLAFAVNVSKHIEEGDASDIPGSHLANLPQERERFLNDLEELVVARLICYSEYMVVAMS